MPPDLRALACSAPASEQPPAAIPAESLFRAPGRASRPKRMAIILRGLPGSGKSAVARKLRELEVGAGGEPPRVHSIDDYFVTVRPLPPRLPSHPGGRRSHAPRGASAVQKYAQRKVTCRRACPPR